MPPQGHALMGWVPYPAHMGPHFVGPITPFGLQKIKYVDSMGAYALQVQFRPKLIVKKV